MRVRSPRGQFGSEAELCDALITLARENGFAVHAECDEWDLLLVHSSGVQIGVEAKMRPNVDVLAQALVGEWRSGPGIHAVLVPGATTAFSAVAARLHILVFRGTHLDSSDLEHALRTAYRWKHTAPAWVPDVEVICPAGTPSPRRTTPWKLSAVRLCLRLRERGYVTPSDMRELKLNYTWWFQRGHALLKRMQRGQYVFVDPNNQKLPDLRWPEIVDAIRVEEKRVAALTAPPRTGPKIRRRDTSAVSV